MYLFRCKACVLILVVVTLWELQAPGPQLCQWQSTEGWWDTGLTLGYWLYVTLECYYLLPVFPPQHCERTICRGLCLCCTQWRVST